MLSKLYKVKQKFPQASISDYRDEIAKLFATSPIRNSVRPGMRIAVATGSRGINSIDLIVRFVIEELKKLKAEVFIVPAMGSHGGATSDGQIKVLKSLGISEDTMGVSVFADMQVKEIGKTRDGVPVFIGNDVLQADGYFVINRIKAHTDFKGEYESGIIKMMAIGLGKHQGCTNLHMHGLGQFIPLVSEVMLKETPFLGGLAILENAREETVKMEIILPNNLFERERELLAEAKSIMAKLPFPELDVLIVKEMGKTISGTGMDTNVIGRLRIEGEPEPKDMVIKRIVVLNLRDDSYGNALGIGLADITTKRLVQKINYQNMYANVISTSFLERGKIPITLDYDKEAIEVALSTIGPVRIESIKLAVIKNTLELEEMYISNALMNDIRNKGNIEVLDELDGIPFDENGYVQLF